MEGLVDGEGDDGMNVKMYMRATTDPASRAIRRLDMTKQTRSFSVLLPVKTSEPEENRYREQNSNFLSQRSQQSGSKHFRQQGHEILQH